MSPADRDEIAAALGLSNAQVNIKKIAYNSLCFHLIMIPYILKQVITWFQNRRAKMKRDMEELKKDVESVKLLTAHKSFLENVNDMNILKKKIVHHEHPKVGHS